MLAITILAVTLACICLMVSQSKSPISMFAMLLSMIMVMVCQLILSSSMMWFAFILFMGMVGGLMLLFAFVLSSSSKLEKHFEGMSLPASILLVSAIPTTVSFFSNHTPNIYVASVPPILLMIICLNLALSAISKLLINPTSPMKCSSY